MDTTTVLAIIEMIETQRNVLINDDDMFQEECYGAISALNELQRHLQSFIEGQLNAEENNTVE